MLVTADYPGFNPQFDVVSAFLEYQGKFLFLHRLPEKPEGGKWGAPAGKVDRGEVPGHALIREIVEETNITVLATQLRFLGTEYVIHDDVHFVYHTYHVAVSEQPEVVIKPDELQGYGWFTKQGALLMPLVTDMDTCIEKYLV